MTRRGTQFVVEFATGRTGGTPSIRNQQLTEVTGIPPRQGASSECKTDKAKAVMNAVLPEWRAVQAHLKHGVMRRKGVANHHSDTPWRIRPATSGRTVELNRICQHFAGNNMDVIIYGGSHWTATVRSALQRLSSASKRCDGAYHRRGYGRKSGMNFLRWRVTSGNTDLLDKAKLEKHTSLEGNDGRQQGQA